MPPSLRRRPPLGWVSKLPWPHRLPSQVVTTVSVCYTGDRCLVLPERAECGHALLGPTPVKIALLAIAGAAGALARYGLGSAFTSRDFPWTTLGINLVGSFALGFLLRAGDLRGWSDVVTVSLGAGFLGAFTTFSTFSVETQAMLRDGRTVSAGLYVCASVVGGIAAAGAGYALATSRGAG